MRSDFAAFILTHGRPDRQYTLDTLKRCGYTGAYYLVIDNEDDTAGEYFKRYGDKVIQFDKLAVSRTFDTGDNFSDRRTIVYARNACFQIAKNLGIRYFLELDDDYTSFCCRYVKDGKFTRRELNNIDGMFELMIQLLNDTKAVTVAFAQNGDFVGGALEGGAYSKGILRKAMNTFFCDTERPFTFVGRINEDVNTYTSEGSRGKLFLTVTGVSIQQKQTQSNKGGMTDVYLDSGTYVKSFYTVMYSPSCTTVMRMGGNTQKRIHHHVEWSNCVPKIISDRYRKEGG